MLILGLKKYWSQEGTSLNSILSFFARNSRTKFNFTAMHSDRAPFNQAIILASEKSKAKLSFDITRLYATIYCYQIFHFIKYMQFLLIRNHEKFWLKLVSHKCPFLRTIFKLWFFSLSVMCYHKFWCKMIRFHIKLN